MSTVEAPESAKTEVQPSIFEHCQDASEFIFLAAQGTLAGNRAAMLLAAAATLGLPKTLRPDAGPLGLQFMRDVFTPFERANCLGDALAKLLGCDVRPKSDELAKSTALQMEVLCGVALGVSCDLLPQSEFNRLVAKNDPKAWMDKFVEIGDESSKRMMEKLGASELPPEIKQLLKSLLGDVSKAFKDHGHDDEDGPNKGVTSIRRGPKPENFPS